MRSNDYLLAAIIADNSDFKPNRSSFWGKRNLLILVKLYCTRIITKESKIMNLIEIGETQYISVTHMLCKTKQTPFLQSLQYAKKIQKIKTHRVSVNWIHWNFFIVDKYSLGNYRAYNTTTIIIKKKIKNNNNNQDLHSKSK